MMNDREQSEILARCKGVKIIQETTTTWRGGSGSTKAVYYKTGDLVPPDDIFVKVTSTSITGTIGKLVGLELASYDDKTGNGDRLHWYGAKCIIQIDGRPKTSRISTAHCEVINGHDGTTEWVRVVKSHPKVVVKNPQNKFKQEMKKGDWVIGVRPGKLLGIGQITRWTNHNVWGELNGREFKFDTIQQTFTMPNDEHVKSLTFAILKGWSGVQ